MRGLWSVFRLEARLLLRGRGLWIAAAVASVLGVWVASMGREVPYAIWSQLTTAAFFLTLILTLSTGGQIVRDREQRVDGVVLSTPISAWAYVWGKYLAALASLLALTVLMLAAAVVMDHFDAWRDPPAALGHSHYPALGPWPYVFGWLWLAVAPVIFGAALALAGVTLTGGQRVVTAVLAVFLWLGPAFFGGAAPGGWMGLLDISGMSLYSAIGYPPLPPALQALVYLGGSPSPSLGALMVRIVDAHMPPQLPAPFVWGRALYVALALLLALALVWRVRAMRRGAA
ncbi:MAG TPA: hypothetical protein VGR57_14620 [Ktedonobacterales bacterium]|nr:hypothetical protein [Ktedonobacterales bacterium]